MASPAKPDRFKESSIKSIKKGMEARAQRHPVNISVPRTEGLTTGIWK